ncbi:hydroxyphenylacetyl-CoA thioesterase PaaI [Rhizobium oryzihabitans]|jgi:acyl-CoA thioesterase|uniref:Hydroxyphenylacetyl-CoA thioesterase PaaI n=2 Tax=Rhizobium/Agrobacterium group TaxID=227290 RepID=A0A2W5FEE4_9HYPH|nr:hydroxyphenylacetyl-CoA thioesterase PaaI [Rhizobium oryzihabitans]PZP54385.1 MAG: hydroxyphenylacetyl-CoA thioesterase PaaI [Agrobacterium fabrum]QCM07524.1 hydroxyphenylacetyl-CoA thioesterase PaaI [Agrobacterium tumefaciens]QIB40516.1 hydroxyphenylacetyl-CoA thioesterase PaaI [Rhizobium oryzihabitans]CUX56965.1 phenylacetic acid degradation protein with thioesterase/thiol ester dehydrase-isomerase domain [Agrobacterium genomosp. 5 str. CFBP 6626]
MSAASLSPQALAEACAKAMWDDDNATRHLGMELLAVAPGEATITMTIAETMTNGHGTCHGGYIFTLADSAFAFACNTYNQRTVAQHCSVTYIAPAFKGDRLTATAREVSRRGRAGIYDIRITNQEGEHVAEFRGHSRTVKGTHLPE